MAAGRQAWHRLVAENLYLFYKHEAKSVSLLVII